MTDMDLHQLAHRIFASARNFNRAAVLKIAATVLLDTNMNPEHKFAQLALRAWPFPQGSGHIIDKLFLGLKFRQKIATVKTNDGFSMTVEPNDLVGRHIYLKGDFDRSVADILCSLARPGDRLLDIGANVGYVSARFLHQVPNSSVIAVEPQPKLIELLSRNLSQFGGERFSIMPFAISDHDGEAAFETNGTNSGAARLTDRGSGKVPVRSANGLFETGKFDGCTVVKIDVEGHEEQVFKSCAKAFHEIKPRAIVFEQQGTKASPQETIGAILSSLGYSTFAIRKSLTGVNLSPVRRRSDCIANDYIATRGG